MVFANKKQLAYNTDLVNGLAGKANTSHNHSISDVTNLSSEINSLKSSVSSGKATIAAAVTDKGVQTAADATFQEIANNIEKITSLASLSKFELIDATGVNISAYRYFSVTNWSIHDERRIYLIDTVVGSYHEYGILIARYDSSGNISFSRGSYYIYIPGNSSSSEPLTFCTTTGGSTSMTCTSNIGENKIEIYCRITSGGRGTTPSEFSGFMYDITNIV